MDPFGGGEPYKPQAFGGGVSVWYNRPFGGGEPYMPFGGGQPTDPFGGCEYNRRAHLVQEAFFFWNVSLSIEAPLGTPPPDKPWARPTRTRVRTVHSAILRLAGVLHGHNLLRAPHKHLQRLCKIWSLVRRITSEVAAAGAAATVSSLSLSGMPIQCGCG